MRTLVGGGVVPELRTMGRPSILQRHTTRLWSVPDAFAMDKLQPRAIAALVQRSIIWKKFITNIPVMNVIVMKMHVVLLLLTVGVVHICSLTGGASATSAPRLGFKLSVIMVS